MRLAPSTDSAGSVLRQIYPDVESSLASLSAQSPRRNRACQPSASPPSALPPASWSLPRPARSRGTASRARIAARSPRSPPPLIVPMVGPPCPLTPGACVPRGSRTPSLRPRSSRPPTAIATAGPPAARRALLVVQLLEVSTHQPPPRPAARSSSTACPLAAAPSTRNSWFLL